MHSGGAAVAGQHAVPPDVAHLAAAEALQRLELLSEVSNVLDTTLDDSRQAARRVTGVCVPAFADLCAIELVSPRGEWQTVAHSIAEGSGLRAPDKWRPFGPALASSTVPLLAFDENEGNSTVASARRALNARSLLVVPITEGGLTLGLFVGATGPGRRAFRPSAVRIGVEIASRLAAAVQRITLHLEMQAATQDQARAVRRLRRLATAAADLAGAASTSEVLDVACREACFIQQADGAMARWWMPDGTVVEGRAGTVDEELAEKAFRAAAGGRFAREKDWAAYPLLPNQVRRRAALAIFVHRELSYDEELVLASLASLVPVAFERAVGTGAALAQEARVRAVVSSSPVALVGLGTNGLVTLANPAARSLFGWGLDEAGAVLPPTLQPTFDELAVAVRSSGVVANRVVSAGPFELSLSAAPMPAISDGGDELSVLVAATDLSDVKRAERALVQAQRLEAMGLVAGRAAHDFNNVLTLIIGYTEVLGRNPSEDVQRLALANINRAARRAATLTQQLLGLAGRPHDIAMAVDLASELRELRTVLERLAGDRVTASIVCPEQPVVVAMGPSEVEQVVLNLAINSCQAMEEGGALAIQLALAPTKGAPASGLPTTRTEPGREADPRWAVLTVADSGTGMPEEVRAHCMEPFFTTKGRRQGTGLGLPTVHALVTEAGGLVDIDSAPGEGTTVTVWLPLSDSQPLSSEAEPVEAWPAGKVLSGRALLVEDDDEQRDLAARTLRDAGLQVKSVGSAEAALQAAPSDSAFDILVTDVMLPGRSGVDLARDLHAGVAGLPLLFVTGYSQAAGPLPPPSTYTQVLRKPYRPDELVFTVAVLLDAGRSATGEPS